MSAVCALFRECVRAIRNGVLVERRGRQDKEFHFQDWIRRRLDGIGERYELPGRNTYPDFRLANRAEGYEVKGLAYPGREADYDGNSRVPRGEHDGCEIFYVFGRYPANPDGDRYPVLDLAICHGSFLNADKSYVHRNKSFRGFGSYGDILVRDRKTYVAPTPFAMVEGLAHRRTLILPASMQANDELVEVGRFVRREASETVVAYDFDLRSAELTATLVPNPSAGTEHAFKAYRLHDDPTDPSALRYRSAK